MDNHLTALTHYGAPAPSTGNDPVRLTLKVSGNRIEYVSQNKDEPEIRLTATFVIAGTKLDLTAVCPVPDGGGGGEDPNYSATPTTLKLYIDAEYTLTKQ